MEAGSRVVPAFWAPLKRKIALRGISQKQLGTLVGLSVPAVSELLGGKRSKAPDWDLLQKIVSAVAEPHELTVELAYWRRRLDELVIELEQASYAGGSDPADLPQPDSSLALPSCLICDDPYRAERFSVDRRELGGAAYILAGRRDELLSEFESLASVPLDSVAELSGFRDEFTDGARALLEGLGETVRKACRPHRIWFLHAAHTVLIAQALVVGPVLDDVDPAADGFAHNLLFSLFHDDTFSSSPVLLADVDPMDHYALIIQYYGEVFADCDHYRLDPDLDPDPDRDLDSFRDTAIQTAEVYRAMLGELTRECPELFVWAGMQDGPDAAHLLGPGPAGQLGERLRGIYQELGTQHRGMAGMETLLRALARDTRPGEWPARLSEIYRRELQRPISPIGELDEAADGLRIPRLEEGYVNPAFRTATHHNGDSPQTDSWWDDKPLRSEIQGFLAGFLASAPTINKPLIILGDPGTGKSLLTRLLAARLPAADYLPIRVELRKVHADIPALDQVTEALRGLALDTTWGDVAAASTGVLPVLIFDGFDELLQAGGADHWGYLEKLARVQEAAADRGRPVAVIVTSRTVVADQARIPEESVMMRLEPFDAERIDRWLEVWNRINKGFFRQGGGAPLRRDGLQQYGDLAEQPLLLMMLALYFAVGRKSQQQPEQDAGFTRVELYEQLFRLFIRRQVTKLDPDVRPEELEIRTSRELDYLAVIAFAMFNRGRQGVTAEEADHDLDLLCPDPAAPRERAKLLFGRFFFIHEAMATFGDRTDRRWYEFLHATFGEFLVARRIAELLADESAEKSAMLCDLLSHRPLSDRIRVMEDLRDLKPPTAGVAALFRDSLKQRPGPIRTSESEKIPATRHYAYCSANLLLLALVPGPSVFFSELTKDRSESGASWRSHAMLWSSQFSPASWDAFTRVVTPLTAWWRSGSNQAGVRDVSIHWSPGETLAITGEVMWTHMLQPEKGGPIRRRNEKSRGVRPGQSDSAVVDSLRRSRFFYDPDIEMLLNPAFAMIGENAFLMDVFRESESRGEVTAAHDLVALLTNEHASEAETISRYDSCAVAIASIEWDDRCDSIAMLLAERFAADVHLDWLSPDATRKILDLLLRIGSAPVWMMLWELAVGRTIRVRRSDTIDFVRGLLRYHIETTDVAKLGRMVVPSETPEAVFAMAADALLRTGPGGRRDDALFVLIEHALDHQFDDWCHRYAGKIFDATQISPESAGLTPLQRMYLQSIVPDIARGGPDS